MNVAARLAVLIGADVDGAVRGMNQVGNQFDQLTNRGRAMGDVFRGTFGAQLLMDGIRLLGRMGGAAVGVYSQYESLGMSLTQLVAREMLVAGSAESMRDALDEATVPAKELLSWVEQLAIKSPFDAYGVTMAMRTAMAYGFTTQEARRLTQATIDYSSATGAGVESMNRISLALGQIKAKGQLAGQEVLQLVNAGIDVNGSLARAFGVSTQEIVRMREEGLIPAEAAIEAIVSVMEEDFAGAAENANDLFGGMISTIDELKDIGLREFFGSTFEAIKPTMKDMIEMLQDPRTAENLRKMGTAFGEFIVKVLDKGLELIEWFGGLDKGVQKLILTAGTAGLAFGPLQRGVGNVLTTGRDLIQLLPSIGGGMKTVGDGAASVAGGATSAAGALNVYAAAIVTAGIAAYKAYELHKQIENSVDGVDQAFQNQLATASDSQGVYREWQGAFRGMNKAYEEAPWYTKPFIKIKTLEKNSLEAVSKALAGSSSSYDEYIGYMQRVYFEAGVMQEHGVSAGWAITDLGNLVRKVGPEYGLLSEAMWNATQATDPFIERQLMIMKAAEGAGEEIEGLTGVEDLLAGVIEDAGEKAQTASERLDGLNTSIGNVIASFAKQIEFDLAVDVEGFQQRFEDIRTALDNGIISEESAEQFADQLYAAEKLQELQGGIITKQEFMRGVVDQTGMSWQEVGEIAAGTRDILSEYDLLFEAAMMSAAGLTAEVETARNMLALAAEEAARLDALEATIDVFFRYQGAGLPKQVARGGLLGDGVDYLPQAEGGDYLLNRPTLFLAGEAGPERAIFIPQGQDAPEDLQRGGNASAAQLEMMMGVFTAGLERLERVNDLLPERLADALAVR